MGDAAISRVLFMLQQAVDLVEAQHWQLFRDDHLVSAVLVTHVRRDDEMIAATVFAVA